MSNSLRPHGLQHARPPWHHQTHVHWVSDAIQPTHPLSSPLLLPSIFPSIKVFSLGKGLGGEIAALKMKDFIFTAVSQRSFERHNYSEKVDNGGNQGRVQELLAPNQSTDSQLPQVQWHMSAEASGISQSPTKTLSVQLTWFSDNAWK